MYSIGFAIHSEVGRIRKNNQDAGYASPNLLLVADGMGGAAAGDLASAVAANEAARSDHRPANSDEALERIAGMVARANAKLTDLIDEDLELDGMGTTFCGVMFDGTSFSLAHVGDSRGYLLRDGELTQLTHDHSWVQSLIDEGKITPEQAAIHPHRSLILKVLNGQVTFEPDFDVIEAQLGDRIMFCSDGLSGLISDTDIHELLGIDDREQAIERMAQAANDAGGHDNITIVVADVVEQDDALDAVEGVLVGSATEVTVPRTGQLAQEKGLAAKEAPYPAPAESPTATTTDSHDESEAARYSPQESKRRWPGVLALILAIGLVIGGGTAGVWAYSKSRYFVTADDGVVTIYNGLPGAFLGIELNSFVEETGPNVADLPVFYQERVERGIQVDSLAGARGTTGELHRIADECIATRERRRQPKPTPTPTVSPSPSPSASASPTTPGLPFQSAEPAASGTPTAPGLPFQSASPSTSPGPSTFPTSASSGVTYLFPTELGTVAPTDEAEADPGEC